MQVNKNSKCINILIQVHRIQRKGNFYQKTKTTGNEWTYILSGRGVGA